MDGLWGGGGGGGGGDFSCTPETMGRTSGTKGSLEAKAKRKKTAKTAQGSCTSDEACLPLRRPVVGTRSSFRRGAKPISDQVL